MLVEVLCGSLSVNADHFVCKQSDLEGADADRWEGLTMEFMSHAISARFRGSLTFWVR